MKAALLVALFLLQCGLSLCDSQFDMIYVANSMRRSHAETHKIPDYPALIYSPELESLANQIGLYCPENIEKGPNSKYQVVMINYKDHPSKDQEFFESVSEKYLLNPGHRKIGFSHPKNEGKKCDKFDVLVVLESGNQIPGGDKCKDGLEFKGLCWGN